MVSAVNRFSHVSKVNTLCITQICKCFHYNTGFFLDTYRVRLLPESRRQPLSVEHSRFAPNPGSDSIKSRSRWGLDLHFVGQCSLAEAATPCHSGHAALAPPLSSCFLWYQQTTACGGDLTCISVLYPPNEGPPKPLLLRDVFTPLFLCTGVTTV